MKPPNKTIDEADKSTNASPRPRQIFALLIGIDEYKNSGEIIKNLSGGKNDFHDIIDFLRHHLHVPNLNITQLCDKDATLAGITGVLKNLAKDPRITEGDAIIVFYAGHGTEGLPARHLDFDKKIQLLAPYDFHFSQSLAPPLVEGPGNELMYGDSFRTEFAVVENGLTYIEFWQLLEDIADAKGNNITVILDCGQDGYDTRRFGSTEEGPTVSARSIDLPVDTRLSGDTFPVSRGSSDKRPRLESYTLLTACGRHQRAFEKGGRGVFTSSLTALLRSQNMDQMTYGDIIASLPKLQDQDPECEGINNNRIFLRGYNTGRRCIPYTIRRITKNGAGGYVIDAGNAHGLTVGDEFTIYDTMSCNHELGHVIVDRLGPFWSSLYPLECAQVFDIPETGAFALRTRVADNVRLLVDPKSECDRTLLVRLEKETAATSAGVPSFNLVAKREELPDLVISSSGGIARFEITDKTCLEQGLHEIFHRPAMNEKAMGTVLSGVSHFYQFFHHKATKTDSETNGSNVEVECFELTRGYIDRKRLRITRFPKEGNLVKNGVINVEVTDSEQKCYGFRLENKSDIPHFVSVFYFDMSDLSIFPYYSPPSPSSQNNSPCLDPHGYLTIGYGSSNTRPVSFFLRKGQDVDVGYMRLFLSTQRVDYQNVSQESPFSFSSKHRGSQSVFHRWDIVDIPIIQRRVEHKK